MTCNLYSLLVVPPYLMYEYLFVYRFVSERTGMATLNRLRNKSIVVGKLLKSSDNRRSPRISG